MKQGYIILAVILLLFSCKSEKQKKLEVFVNQIESVGIDKFRNIEYSFRGDTEVFNYLKSDTVFTSWRYNLLEKRFVGFDSLKLQSISENPGEYMQQLRNLMKSLRLESVSQSSWPGKIFKLWMSDAEYLIYVQPGFNLESPSCVLMKEEVQSSMKITDSWYYKRLKVCRNK